MSKETHIQQRCNEYSEIKMIHLQNNFNIKECLFTPHSEYKNCTYDFELSFLDDFVQESIDNGAQEFDDEKKNTAITLTGTQDAVHEKELNFAPYERPTRGAVAISTQPRIDKPTFVSSNAAAGAGSGLKLNVKSGGKKGRWQKGGLVTEEKETKETTPTASEETKAETSPPKELKLNTKPTEKKTFVSHVEKEDKKKQKVKSALFAGVVKKGKHSDSDNSDSDSDQSDSDDDKKKKKHKKNKKKDSDEEEITTQKTTTQSTKPDADDLFDLGESHNLEPFGKPTPTDDEILLGKDAPVKNDLGLDELQSVFVTPSAPPPPTMPQYPQYPGGVYPQQYPPNMYPGGAYGQPMQYMGGVQPQYGYYNYQATPGVQPQIPPTQSAPSNDPFSELIGSYSNTGAKK